MADNFFGATDTGKLRDNNEDTFIAESLPGGWIAACVIDGVGGYEGGEVAADIARTTILEQVKQPFDDALKILRQSLTKANQNIYDQKLKGGNPQMACVLTAALVNVEANQFYYAHVGDTRMYLLRDGSLVKVTKDQSFVGFLEDSGRLSEKEAMAHPKRNEINNALGFDAQSVNDPDYIETGSSPFLPGDVLLLCSDGLTDLVNNEGMSAALLSTKSLQQKAQDLIDAANAAGGKDNITVVLVVNNKKAVKQKTIKPSVKTNTIIPATLEDALVTEAPPESANIFVPEKRRSGGAVFILSFLCLLLAGGCYWLWRKNSELTKEKVVIQTVRNTTEKKLGDSISVANKIFLLRDSLFGKSITLTDTIFIRQDSLRIDGGGISLQSDSSYTGPAFFVTANCKYLLMENIGFKDFTAAVVMQGKGLSLKNVVFQNVATPVQQNFLLPLNDTISGIVKDSFILKKIRYQNKFTAWHHLSGAGI